MISKEEAMQEQFNFYGYRLATSEDGCRQCKTCARCVDYLGKLCCAFEASLKEVIPHYVCDYYEYNRCISIREYQTVAESYKE